MARPFQRRPEPIHVELLDQVARVGLFLLLALSVLAVGSAALGVIGILTSVGLL